MMTAGDGPTNHGHRQQRAGACSLFREQRPLLQSSPRTTTAATKKNEEEEEEEEKEEEKEEEEEEEKKKTALTAQRRRQLYPCHRHLSSLPCRTSFPRAVPPRWSGPTSSFRSQSQHTHNRPNGIP